MSDLVAVVRSTDERIVDLEKERDELVREVADLEARVSKLEARTERDAESHEYLGDVHWDEALHGLVRVIVREGYAAMDNLRNDPSMTRFLTTSDWLRKYFRQQFTQDRDEPTFACADPDYELVSFSFTGKHEVFAVTFRGWMACGISTATDHYLSSVRKGVQLRKYRIIRSLAAANGIEMEDRFLVHSVRLHEDFGDLIACDGRMGLVTPSRIDPAPIFAKFKRVRTGPRPGGRPRKVV